MKYNKNGKRTLLDHVFFSHKKTNSCGVLIAYYGKETFIGKEQETEREGFILILDVSANDFD